MKRYGLRDDQFARIETLLPGRPGTVGRSSELGNRLFVEAVIWKNQPFGEWGKIFPDQAMTLAAIDRLVHHATILEMNVESYRRREALDRKRGRGRPPTHATIKETQEVKLIDVPRQSKRLPRPRPATIIALHGCLVSS